MNDAVTAAAVPLAYLPERVAARADTLYAQAFRIWLARSWGRVVAEREIARLTARSGHRLTTFQGEWVMKLTLDVYAVGNGGERRQPLPARRLSEVVL